MLNKLTNLTLPGANLALSLSHHNIGSKESTASGMRNNAKQIARTESSEIKPIRLDQLRDYYSAEDIEEIKELASIFINSFTDRHINIPLPMKDIMAIGDNFSGTVEHGILIDRSRAKVPINNQDPKKNRLSEDYIDINLRQIFFSGTEGMISTYKDYQKPIFTFHQESESQSNIIDLSFVNLLQGYKKRTDKVTDRVNFAHYHPVSTVQSGADIYNSAYSHIDAVFNRDFMNITKGSKSHKTQNLKEFLKLDDTWWQENCNIAQPQRDLEHNYPDDFIKFIVDQLKAKLHYQSLEKVLDKTLEKMKDGTDSESIIKSIEFQDLVDIASKISESEDEYLIDIFSIIFEVAMDNPEVFYCFVNSFKDIFKNDLKLDIKYPFVETEDLNKVMKKSLLKMNTFFTHKLLQAEELPSHTMTQIVTNKSLEEAYDNQQLFHLSLCKEISLNSKSEKEFNTQLNNLFGINILKIPLSEITNPENYQEFTNLKEQYLNDLMNNAQKFTSSNPYQVLWIDHWQPDPEIFQSPNDLFKKLDLASEPEFSKKILLKIKNHLIKSPDDFREIFNTMNTYNKAIKNKLDFYRYMDTILKDLELNQQDVDQFIDAIQLEDVQGFNEDLEKIPKNSKIAQKLREKFKSEKENVKSKSNAQQG
ncbi:MAG: hypothetical protein MK033_07485 [Candidatus Caenarcaniphilales bacterium]|nr:hypothetical protein [Candidatus Caenarcaniphilales bacterium]